MDTISKRSRSLNEAMSIKFNTIVYEKKQRGEDVIVLSLGEAYFDIPLFSFEELSHPDLYHYSHSRGLIGLREKLATYFMKEYDVHFNPNKEILITAGSKAAIQMALLAIVDHGDEVIYQEPAWVSYPEEIKICDGIPIAVPMDKSVYNFESFISSKTKCIIINNPNNPTGYVYSKQELEHLLSLAKKHNIYILSDEAYSDFVLDKDEFVSFASIDKSYGNSIICNSISKNYGISGWRLGYVISNETLTNEILKFQQHIITCAPTVLQMYIEKNFDRIITITKPQIMNVVKKRQEIAEYLSEHGLQLEEGSATFYFFLSIKNSKLNSVEFCTKLLEEYNVSVVPGLGYGASCDKYIRISIGTEPMERMISAIQSIKLLLEKSS